MDQSAAKRMTITTLQNACEQGEKIAVLTCYDATFAAVLEEAGVDILLVGDSLGNVVQGKSSTLPVTLDEMIYHVRCVERGTHRVFIMADMPFGTFQVSPQEAFGNAVRLMAAGAQMVKIEGGQHMAETVEFLSCRGIPVCAHIGLMPQFVHQLGGYRVQGKTPNDARQLREDALLLQEAGAAMLLMELIPAVLGEEITRLLSIPTIGIGAGAACSGQVLVLHDMLGISSGTLPRFVRNFMMDADSIQTAVSNYVEAVKLGAFPAYEHTF
ncbi:MULTISPECIES: 3-methyl-2-oxobutanoate hydroxymethyltransferase [Nitrosomonas]|uniref:3-methyl-2-oxobutanoate hydroxymethyltransferase n=1 Tax=Nitrosomonas europaea (strain ATCC 19718 / CIP 103999 / KCTC 2705 / NBRC 14298) TaxID=228410 RepID=PANB_NITEU|nr:MULTISPECIES: 3-methyl-2-oxobutanoate hydroxymethyltransferase [Nitrosomonas]Q82Y18.1 RecName: Full=3-methyl-2-oxobutanoate hydroxymethyltransferase; AltName: Full=Ketopantoate hydroxymethyltransferase; Short=KPHMT [Nitrosomonas europaea ATCC 19718]KXK42521.1 MAG: 3-methyl-2-oxobutanoate hydroxymethyltransferase [Nitrosomonas europaea]CAD83983.1 Ketopantoate hydroxymethyltransferase [Nitrosomonas europaea ATCC 19718]SDW00466.1 ketopantoate hydroxymethyltransferase [Nitrosomonas europaea]SES